VPARRFAGGRTSVGLGASYSHLDGVEGVGLLYPFEPHVRQDGSASDLRLGLTHALPGARRLDLVLLRNEVDMTKEGLRLDVSWDEHWVPTHSWRPWSRRDRTRTLGAQVGFTTPLPEDGWRAGLTATSNHLRHPGSADPISGELVGQGESWAYNLGLGASREDGPVSFGLDLVYEPIWSSTQGMTMEWQGIGIGWPTTTPRFDREVQNRFRFDNAHLRIGAGREIGPLGVQLGTHLHSVRYTLRETEIATGMLRERRESWMEWKPTWGVSARFPDIEVRYTGSYLSGVGRPHGGFNPGQLTGFVSNIIVAPLWGYDLQEARVLSHRVSVSLPIELGRRR
jgi:hypothetical protein